MYRKFFKRVLDIVCSALALIVLSPLFIILAIIVRIKHGSPIIFTQYRPGKDGKIFKFIKFRTMANRFDENGILLPDEQRITKFGKALRKTSLDELPQLWLILIGKMSFIGPRPRMVEECVFLNEDQQARFKVRPGITGLAQVNGRNNIAFDKVAEFDKQYVDNITFWGDIKILFQTFVKVFKKDGVNPEGATVSNEVNFYGKYLLNNSKIDQKYYDENINFAREQIKEAEKKIANHKEYKYTTAEQKIAKQLMKEKKLKKINQLNKKKRKKIKTKK